MSGRETDAAARDRNHWPHVEGVQFVLGGTVWAYESGRVNVVPWGRHGNIGRIEWGAFRHLSDEDGYYSFTGWEDGEGQ
jgi:hypothetical protein